jgi:hypothetical protein
MTVKTVKKDIVLRAKVNFINPLNTDLNWIVVGKSETVQARPKAMFASNYAETRSSFIYVYKNVRFP